MKNVVTLKAFKESFSVGDKWRLTEAYLEDGAGGYKPDLAHKALGLLREVHGMNTKDLMFKMLEGPRAGQVSHMQWPKASELLSFDGRGFTIISKDWGCKLVYARG